jgi:hypothetical protein
MGWDGIDMSAINLQIPLSARRRRSTSNSTYGMGMVMVLYRSDIDGLEKIEQIGLVLAT